MNNSKQKKGGMFSFFTHEVSGVVNFLHKLSYPTKEQFFTSIKLQAMAIGLVGVVGYVIKLVHIPINNILVNKPN
ncbi:protein translocase SEC61 complex gamma subunit [Vairimorpha necatrix]|uniref:Protein translocase SEC61 complex gamma subunit n=1 Tax=Vairimorpha necatrix TaxID=6039 RepID=A0AAX4JC59_9MICR